MPSFTVKNIPDPLFEKVRAAAELHHRSINGEILACLERSFGVTLEPAELLARASQLRAQFKGPPLTWDEIQAAKVKGRP
jgi:plasmid stability protein